MYAATPVPAERTHISWMGRFRGGVEGYRGGVEGNAARLFSVIQ